MRGVQELDAWCDSINRMSANRPLCNMDPDFCAMPVLDVGPHPGGVAAARGPTPPFYMASKRRMDHTGRSLPTVLPITPRRSTTMLNR